MSSPRDVTEPESITTRDETKQHLENYLNDKNINNALVSIVEALLLKKPENPIGFIVEFVIQKYPKETESVLKMVTEMTEAGHSRDVVKSREKRNEVNDSDSYSESSNSEVIVSSLSDSKRRMPEKKRRNNICAADKLGLKEMETKVKMIPKTDEEANRIQEILKKNILFQHLDEEQLMIVQGAIISMEKREGEVIIKQGDNGDKFFVVDYGTVNAYVRSSDKDDSYTKDGGKKGEKLVATYGSGDSFGELAIMYNAPRAATCVAARGSVKLWALDRISFKLILMQTTTKRRNELKRLLESVKLLSSLTDTQVLKVVDLLQEERFESGNVIFREGEIGDKFYIVEDGCAVCSKTISKEDGTSSEKEVVRLTRGSHFGEIALTTPEPRQTTVVASGGVLKCFTLDRDTFQRVMGPPEKLF